MSARPPTCRSASPGPTTPRRSPTLQLRTWREMYADLRAGRGAARRRRGRRRGLARLAEPARRTPATGCSWRSSATGWSASRSPRPRATPTATRSPTPSSPRSPSTRPSAARATARGCSRRPSTPCVADRFERAVLWSMAGDDALRDVPHRGRLGAPTARTASSTSTATGTTLVKQVRLHTALTDQTALDFPGYDGHDGDPLHDRGSSCSDRCRSSTASWSSLTALVVGVAVGRLARPARRRSRAAVAAGIGWGAARRAGARLRAAPRLPAPRRARSGYAATNPLPRG